MWARIHSEPLTIRGIMGRALSAGPCRNTASTEKLPAPWDPYRARLYDAPRRTHPSDFVVDQSHDERVWGNTAPSSAALNLSSTRYARRR
jgi:hypothetical protein